MGHQPRKLVQDRSLIAFSSRPSLALPGRQAELIRKVARANPKTVVVVQAVWKYPLRASHEAIVMLTLKIYPQGSAVDLSWSSDVAGVLQAWYSGNEVGNAIADILFGSRSPSGRLPITLPKREVDIPAYPNTKSENGKIHYREDIYVGYKGYHARQIEPEFVFGCVLSQCLDRPVF